MALRVHQGDSPKSQYDERAHEVRVGDITDTMNRIYWLINESHSKNAPPPVEEVIAQAAESLADPNFFIAEVSCIISALVELKEVARQRDAGPSDKP
jgi:hypothetical protein